MTSLLKLRLQIKIKISSGDLEVGLKLSPPVKPKLKYHIRYVDSLRVGDRGGGREKNKYVLTLNGRKVLHYDDDNSRWGPRVRDNQPSVLTPILHWISVSIIARLKQKPQTDKT